MFSDFRIKYYVYTALHYVDIILKSEIISIKFTYASMLFERGHRSIVDWYFMFSICFLRASLSIADNTLSSMAKVRAHGLTSRRWWWRAPAHSKTHVSKNAIAVLKFCRWFHDTALAGSSRTFTTNESISAIVEVSCFSVEKVMLQSLF